LFGIFIDISARREIEAARMELATPDQTGGASPGVVYQYRQRPDGSGYFPYASPHIAEIYDTTPEEAAKGIEFLLARYTRMICRNCVPPLMNLRLS
jgi:hypothetical protein